MNEYVNAIYNQRNPNALKELLEKKKKDLDEALLTVITDMDMATDEKIRFTKLLFKAGASQQEEMMYWSIRENNKQAAEVFLKSGMDPNVADDKGRTYLHYCCEDHYDGSNRSKITKLLLAAGADPNAVDENGRIPIVSILGHEDIKTFKVLLPVSDVNMADDNGNTVAHLFAQGPDVPKCVKYVSLLAEKGIDFEARDAQNATPFGVTAWYGEIDCLDVLFKAGADINAECSDDETALALVAGMPLNHEKMILKRAAVCEFLIKNGADVDLAGSSGITPLMNAVKTAHFSILKQLLQANCTAKVPLIISEEQIINFMAAAVSNGAGEYATFVLGDSCQSTEDHCHFYDLSLKPEAMVNGKSIGLSQPPVSLFRLCRLTVRSLLPKGGAFLSAVDNLEVPSRVKNFLALGLLK